VHWTFGFQETSVENPLVDPTVSSPKFRLKGELVPSIHMRPNVFLPALSGAE
jgi:hypothetical protein